MIRRALAISLSLSLAGLPAGLLAGGKGTTSAAFLKVPVNARAVALAGSFTAVPGDVTGLEYNPAGLAGLRRTDIAFTYIDYLEDTSFQSAAVGFPFTFPGRKGPEPADDAFDVRRLFLALRYNQFRADDEGRNEVGIKQGSFNIKDQLFHLGLAAPLGPSLSIGVGVKSIRQELDSASKSSLAFDLGGLWLAPHGFKVGTSLLNLGPAKAFEREKDPLPALLRVGAAKTIRQFLIVADLVRGRDTVTRLSSGAEWSPKKIFTLRGGVFHESEIGFTTGLGFMFAGPQKAAPSLSRRAQRADQKTSELVFNEKRAAELLDRLNLLASELTDRYRASGNRPNDLQIAVLPASGAGERMGPALADLLGQQFYQQEAFSVIERAKMENSLRETKTSVTTALDDEQAANLGRMIGANVVAVSQVTKTPTAYNMSTRLVNVHDGNSAAASSVSFPPDVFASESRHTLASVPDKPTAPPSRLDVGFDYGLSTQGDLGLSHTLSLRILY